MCINVWHHLQKDNLEKIKWFKKYMISKLVLYLTNFSSYDIEVHGKSHSEFSK